MNTLDRLIAMTRHLGDPDKDYVILGEGNTSARADGETFWVKASGSRMEQIGPAGFVLTRFAPALALLDAGGLTDDDIRAGLTAAKADPSAQGHPSIEALLHATMLSLPGVHFVGHTHPVAVNAVMCSVQAEEAISGRLFPDEIIVCGPAPAYVPYTDPGVPLARKVRAVLERHIDDHGAPPKTIYLQNHGLIALGENAIEVENIVAMAVKACHILLGTYALGGPNFMTEKAVARIHTRPDEDRRRAKLVRHTGAG
jgi:rhamnose utilization protein RhaD (predicted bifunctional aldolase and dehydrogenase)